MLKTILLTSITALIFTGCSGGPTPSVKGQKPTIYVKSHTAEKFKDVTRETSWWNGISPFFVNDKQYMRCDMTEEAIAVFARYDFEIVTQQADADYTFDVTLLSCSPYRILNDNRTEIPLKEKTLYKDFMRWVKEEDASKLPKNVKEIADLIAQNKEEGFYRFAHEDMISKYGQTFDYSENWGSSLKRSHGYMQKTGNKLYPSKYANMPDEDREALKKVYKKFQEDSGEAENSAATGSHMVSAGAGMSSLSMPGSSAMGGASAVLGIIKLFGGVVTPTAVNGFKITNNRTGKFLEMEMHFWGDRWNLDTDRAMDDWVIDEIEWGDLE